MQGAVDPMSLVLQFHHAFALDDTREIRLRLLTEEFAEYLAAENSNSAEAIAHELADIVYAAFGTALTYGINLAAALKAVHEANMSRLSPDGSFACDGVGKILKGSTYQPPTLAGAVAEARLDLGLRPTGKA